MAGGLWHHVKWIEWQSQSPCDWRYLIFVFFNPYLYKNYKILQGGVLSALMFSSILALIQVLSERGAILCVRGFFFLLSYIELTLDRTMVQSSNLVYLESGMGAIEWV